MTPSQSHLFPQIDFNFIPTSSLYSICLALNLLPLLVTSHVHSFETAVRSKFQLSGISNDNVDLMIEAKYQI